MLKKLISDTNTQWKNHCLNGVAVCSEDCPNAILPNEELSPEGCTELYCYFDYITDCLHDILEGNI